MSFRNLPLAAKLGAAFGAVVAVVALGATLEVFEARQVTETERLNAVAKDVADEVDQAWGSVAKAHAAVRKYVLTGANVDKDKAEAGIAAFNAHVAEARRLLVLDAPAFVADLDTYKAKVEILMEQGVSTELRLASDPTTRAQAVEMVASGATMPLTTAVDAALKNVESKIDP